MPRPAATRPTMVWPSLASSTMSGAKPALRKSPISWSVAPGLHDQLMGLFRSAGFAPLIVEEASEGHTIVGLVAAGLGISLVPETLGQWRRRDVVYRPLAHPRAFVAMCLGWRRDDRTEAVTAFVATARTARELGLLPGHAPLAAGSEDVLP